MRSLATRLIGQNKRRLQEIEKHRDKINSLVDILNEMKEHWINKGYYREAEIRTGTEKTVFTLSGSFSPDPWDTPLAFNLMLEYFEDKYPKKIRFKDPEITPDSIMLIMEVEGGKIWFPPVGIYFNAKQNCTITPKKETVTYEKTVYDYVCK